MISCRLHHGGYLVQIGENKLYLTFQEAQRLLNLVENALRADLDEIAVADISLSPSDADCLLDALQAALEPSERIDWQQEGF